MKPGRPDEPSTAPPAATEPGAVRTAETVQDGRRRRRAHGSRAAALVARVRDPERYVILGEHGRGALGRVSRARDRELGRDVAIKELMSRGRAKELRFLREVQITARLEHPGIVPVYEAGQWPDGTPFYTMKSVSGRPLRDLIAERPVEQRIDLLHHVIAVADAMAYAHRRNIIHRDLKPSNIIVGEFGETIVIDWGLAKDLASPPEPLPADEPVLDRPDRPGPPGDDLTVAGSILGTPAYMAPEQKRGEQVDQRADVFAIGTLLWELCAADRTPPAEVRDRRRALRQAGIDRDLVTIIDKALEPDPALRYRDAGALAADLKAFKAGARIAARHYSLPALLAHWTRRHRTLAVAAAALVAVAAAASLVYVRNITAARDHADASQELAVHAQSAAEAALDELTLKHAQTLLAGDPTAALDALATYHGADRGRAEQIQAEAIGRGVARIRALTHTNNVLWTTGAAGGAILSLSIDGTIARTAPDGRASVVARGVSWSSAWAYSAARHLLAYACDPSDVCLFDVAAGKRVSAAPALRDARAASMALSPGGGLLAVLSRDGVVSVLDVADPAHPVARATVPGPHGTDVAFVDEAHVAIDAPAGVTVAPLDGEPSEFAAPDGSAWDAEPEAHRLALGTASGQGHVFGVDRLAAHAQLCTGPVTGLKFLPRQSRLAYACRSGTVGIWDPERGTATPRTQLENRADLIAVDASGSYLVAAGGNGTVTVIDLATDLLASYRGHGFRLTSLTPPTADHPFVISGDVRGQIREWPLPTRLVRVAATTGSRFNMAIFDRTTGTIAATTWRSELSIVSPPAAPGAPGAVRTAGPHAPDSIFLEQAPTGSVFAAFGLSDAVELWSSDTMTRIRLLDTGHGSVSQLKFVDAGAFATAGHDGRLVRWTAAGEPTEVARAAQPIDRFAPVPGGGFVFSTVDGALWRSAEGGPPVRLRGPGPRIQRILAVPGPTRIYAGDAGGDVLVIDAATWQVATALHDIGATYEMAATPDGRTVAIATTEGAVHVGLRGSGPGAGDVAWTTWAARARAIAMSPDGVVLATYSDGTIWLYRPADRRWLCMPSGTVDLARAAVAPGGDVAVVADIEGRLISIDLAAARKQLAGGASTITKER